MPADPDFYEDDEPLDKLLAAFDAGEQGLTGPPTRGRTEFISFEAAETAEVRPEVVSTLSRPSSQR